MSKEKKVKIALVGLDGFGKKLAEAISKTSNLNLIACCDSSREIADEYAKKYNCGVFYSLSALLQNKEVEAVALVTPNHLHAQQIKDCFNSNKHIFVEKPITNRLSEAKEIVEKEQAQNLILMVGHNMRRDKAVRKMKELLSQGKIGKIVSAEMNWSHRGGMKLTPDKWRYYKDKCPGGPLIMLGSHMADVSNYLFGPAKKVGAILKKQYAPSETEDTSLMLLELDSGSVVYICNNYNTPGTHFIRIYGTDGILFYNKNLETLSFQGKDKNKKPSQLEHIKYKQNDTKLEEMEEFGNCILQNKKPETGLTQAFNALAIVEAALTSQKENKFIKLAN